MVSGKEGRREGVLETGRVEMQEKNREKRRGKVRMT